MRRATVPWTAVLLAALAAAAGPAAAVSFTDAQAQAGVQWVHASSATQNFVEVTGSGACWGDVDGDGTDDLFLVNGKYGNATQQATLDPRSALYLNDGDGTFTDASKAWGADLSMWGQGCAFADYDGDGDLDLAVNGYHQVALLRNDGLRFADVAGAAGITPEDKCGEGVYCFGTSASWADVDGDGDLDLYLTNYVDYNLDEGGPNFPTTYNGQSGVLWRNRGDGTFVDATAAAKLGLEPGPDHSKSFQAAWADYDRDGDLDVYVTSDQTPNALMRNDGGVFKDVAAQAGVDDDRAGMGLVFADVDGDCLPDLYMTHYELQNNGYYTNDADGTFTDRSGSGDLDNDFLLVGWGAGAHDFDHDGDLDLYVANGHTITEAPDHAQKPLLFLQQADGSFRDASADAGPSFDAASVARGSAAADYDLDGDLDIVLVDSYNRTARILRHGGAPGNWLQVELRQGGMNRDAIGAEVTVTPQGGRATCRVVQAGNSYQSQDSLVVHAGLGSAASATVDVRWPDGARERWTVSDVDERIRLVRGQARVVRDTLSPTTTITLDGPAGDNGWHLGEVTASLAAADRALGLASGVASTQIARDAEALGPYAGPVTLRGDGIHELRARSADHEGNAEPLRVQSVKIDTTPPASSAKLLGTPREDGWYTTPLTVDFDATDATSGVAGVRVRVNGGPWSTVDVLTLTSSGEHVLEYAARDKAGNEEAVRTLVAKVDGDLPRMTVDGWPAAAGAGAVLLQARAYDPTSGVRRVAWYVDLEPLPRHVDADGSDGWTFTLEDGGVHLVRAVATDAVGFAAEVELFAAVGPALPPLPVGLLALAALPLAARRR